MLTKHSRLLDQPIRSTARPRAYVDPKVVHS